MLCAWKYFASLDVPNYPAYYRYPGCYRMSSCGNGVNLLRYLDNELSGQELETFCAHLQNCPTCKVRLEEERTLSTVLHRFRPLCGRPKSFEAKCMRSSRKSTMQLWSSTKRKKRRSVFSLPQPSVPR